MRQFGFALICGSVLALGCTPPSAAPTTPVKPAGGPAPTSGSTATSMVPANVKLVSMKVEDMHCPLGCYPTVEKALAKVAGVSSVKLAEQKKDGTIDNPVVLVQVDGNFDPTAAIAALDKVGFASEMVK